MLLDEPSSGLDVHETEQLGEALRRIRQDRGTAFVLVEHNVEFVLDLSDRVTVLDFGRLLTEGTPDEVRDSPEVQAAYFGAPIDAVAAEPTARGGRRMTAVSTEDPILRVTDLEVAYGEARALFGVSFDVPCGIGHDGARRERRRQVVARVGDRRRRQAERRQHRVRG